MDRQTHWQRYKQLYVGIALGVALAGITLLVVRRTSVPYLTQVRTVPIGETTSPSSHAWSLFGNVSAVTTTHNGRVGHPGFVTRCVDTGEVFLSQGEAARAYGIPESMLSKHLNFGRPLVEGVSFERLPVVQ